jgi:hypothetical protein
MRIAANPTNDHRDISRVGRHNDIGHHPPKHRILTKFVELAEGVDEATWKYHLSRNDYSRWVRYCLEDSVLADEIEQVERSSADARATRETIKKAIERRYTSPA